MVGTSKVTLLRSGKGEIYHILQRLNISDVKI